MESACRAFVTRVCIDRAVRLSSIRVVLGEVVMRVPTGPLFRPFDYALMVVFAMAFIMLTALRLA